MTGRRWLAAAALAVACTGLAYIAFTAYRGSQPEECYACQRPIHAHTRTIAIERGKPTVFCCPACALSEHEQEGNPIRVTQLTAFLTGAKLSPDHAFIVEGSDTNLCARTHGLMDMDKRPADVRFDRCSPSLLAFAQRSEAVEFAREHGGEVAPFSAIVSEFSH